MSLNVISPGPSGVSPSSSPSPAGPLDPKLSAIRDQLNGLFVQSKFYESQQLMKTLSARYVSRKQFETALNLLADGAKGLATHAQVNAAVDIANQYIDTLKKAEKKANEQNIAELLSIIDSLQDSKQLDIVATFIKNAIKWSTAAAPGTTAAAVEEEKKGGPSSSVSSAAFSASVGHPLLHASLGRFYGSHGEYALAHMHFLRAQNEEKHLVLIEEWLRVGAILPSEYDLFLLRTVLQYICVADLKAANFMFKNLKEKMLSKNTQLNESPAVHLSEFILKTVERGKDASPLFDLLRHKYTILLTRDPSLNQYLDRIGELYFGQKTSQGLFDLFR